MLTRLDIQNAGGDTLALPLMDTSGGYVVRDIDGLDPVDAALTSQSYAQTDGVQIQSARRDSRNLTMKLGFAPNNMSNSVGSLRGNLYKYLLPKAPITVKFYVDDTLVAVTDGVVETFQNPFFSSDPEVDLSIICADPDFNGPYQESVSGSTVTSTATQAIAYEGTSDAGVIFTLNVNATLGGFTLYNTRPDGAVQIVDITASLLSGDIVTIDSIPGEKSVKLNRAGLVTSLLYSRDPTSGWISLQQGINHFRAHASVASIPFTVAYTAKYAGLITS